VKRSETRQVNETQTMEMKIALSVNGCGRLWKL